MLFMKSYCIYNVSYAGLYVWCKSLFCSINLAIMIAQYLLTILCCWIPRGLFVVNYMVNDCNYIFLIHEICSSLFIYMDMILLTCLWKHCNSAVEVSPRCSYNWMFSELKVLRVWSPRSSWNHWSPWSPQSSLTDLLRQNET